MKPWKIMDGSQVACENPKNPNIGKNSQCEYLTIDFNLKVYFPSVTICNINQVRESFFLDMELNSIEDETKKIIDLLYKQFYSGSKEPTTPIEDGIVKEFLTSTNYVIAGKLKNIEGDFYNYVQLFHGVNWAISTTYTTREDGTSISISFSLLC